MTKLAFETPDLTQSNIEKIGVLFPSVITEAIDEEKSTPEAEVYKKAINFEALKQLLGGDVAEGNEAYEFTWVGKKNPSLKPINPSEKPSVPAEPRLGDHPKHLY